SLADRTLEVLAHTSLALAAWERDPRRAIGDLEEALRLLRQPGLPAEADLDRREEAVTLGLLARAHATLGESGEALKIADSALAAAASGPFERALALDNRAFVHLRAGRLPQAEADARAAADLFDAAEEKLGKAELARVGAHDQRSTLNDLLQQIVV